MHVPHLYMHVELTCVRAYFTGWNKTVIKNITLKQIVFVRDSLLLLSML